VIRAETATVYRAGGRRFLTLRSAVRGAVRKKLREKCECDYCDHPEMPGCPTEDFPCKYHDNSDRAQKIARRLGRMYVTAFRQARAA